MFDSLKHHLLCLFPDPSDVYEATWPFYIYSKFVGLACYSLKTGNKKQYKVTFAAVGQNIVTVVTYAALLFYNFFTLPVNVFYGNGLEMKVQYFLDIIGNFLAIIELIFGIIFARMIVRIFKNVDEVDKQFRNLGVAVSYKLIYILAISSIVFGTVMSAASIALDAVLLDSPETFFLSFLRVCIDFSPTLINFVFQFQYFQYMSILTQKYRSLNKYLKSLLHQRQLENDAWATKSRHFDEIHKISSSINEGVNSVFVVDTVAALHVKLNDTAMLLNHAFAAQLLLSITISFVGLVTALFLIAMNFSKPAGDEADTNWNFMFVGWAVSIAIYLLATVYVTCNLCEKASKCPRILHRIRNNSTDVVLNRTIEVYSLQMHHNRLQFYVCGLFPLDYTLLYTIVAGITTYLVILIQFNNAHLQRGNEASVTNATSNIST